MTVVVETAGTALLVRDDQRANDSVSLARMLREEDRYTPVVVGLSSAEALFSAEVVDALRGRLRDGRGVRLVAGSSGRPRPDGSPSAATRLANRLGVEVVAPDGELLVLPGGDLFAVGSGAGWISHVRGQQPGKRGPRAPEPNWQGYLPAFPADAVGAIGLSSVHIPAGIWLRGPDAPEAQVEDLVFAIPPDPQRMAVVLGSPSAPLTELDGAEKVIRALPPHLQSTLYVTEYGVGDPEIAAAQRLADLLGRPVRARAGIPLYRPDGVGDPVCVDDDGQWTWQSFAHESVYHPGGAPPTPWRWSAPARLKATGSACYALTADWVVEVVPAGLVVREADALTAPLVARMPAHPDHLYLVVAPPDAPGRTVPASVLVAVEKLIAQLPEAARSRLRLATLPEAPTGAMSVVGAALHTPVVALREETRPERLPRQRGPMPFNSEGFVQEQADAVEQQATGDQVSEPSVRRPAELGPVRVDRSGHVHPAGQGWRRSAPARAAGARSGEIQVPGPATPASVSPPAPVAAVPAPAPQEAHSQVAEPPAADVRSVAVAHHDALGQPAAVSPEPDGTGGDNATAAMSAMSVSRVALASIAGPAAVPPPAARSTSAGEAALAAVPPAPQPAQTESAAADESASGRTESDVDQPPWMAAHARLRKLKGKPPLPAPATPPPVPVEVAVPALPQLPAVLPISVEAPEPGQGEIPRAEHRTPMLPPVAPEPEVPPAPVQEVAPPPAAPEPLRPLLPGHRSSKEDRLRFRSSLGWRYDAATKAVLRLLAERPGLRATDTDAMITELAAVQLFASESHTMVTEAIRRGDAGGQWPFLSCLVGGLGRLQSFQGVVARGGPDDQSAAEAYVVGTDVTEPAPLLATSDLAAITPGTVELLILSLSARRLSGLVEMKFDGHVVFLPGTVFRVLAVDTTPTGRRVLLAELPQTATAPDEARILRITERLRGAVDKRAELRSGDDEQVELPAEAFAFLPGLQGQAA